ncbi:MAG: hypothetical protein HQK96_20725 [Nitrospirae bacterium]|nr:hypothetical protein [Nitrospirota bacterium]
MCFLSDDEYGSWPSYVCVENEQGEEEEVEFDPTVHICPFMEDGEVLIMMTAGAEKLRYITGHAEAYNSEGKWVSVFIEDIYEKAAKKFGVAKSSITACEY